MNKKETKAEKDLIKMNADFPICSVCREDVAYAIQGIDSRKLTIEQARKRALLIDDGTMVHLAHKMANAFGDTGVYNEALKQWVEEYL